MPAIPTGKVLSNPVFQNTHTFPDMKTSIKESSAPPMMTPDGRKCSKRARKKPVSSLEDNSLGTYNSEICQIMNDFYHSPVASKSKISSILEDVKSLNDKEMANSVFISVFQNIKTYMKEIRMSLYGRLKELGLAQHLSTPEENPKSSKKFRRRRHSADSIYEYSEEAQDVQLSGGSIFAKTTKESFALRPFHEAPEKYVEFLIALCEAYKNLIEISSSGVEAICQEILAQCQPNNEVTGYDIHKSLFYDYVLKDRLVVMAVTNAQCYMRDENVEKKHPKLKVAVGAIRKIKAEIRKCRVKITIGKGSTQDEYE